VGRRRVTLAVVLVMVLVTFAAAGCGGGQEAPAGEQVAVDGQTLLEERCTECHDLERTTSQQKTRAEWEETVSRMIDRGAELNEDEKTVLVDYLAENYGP
jgi:cytochrome c5